MEVAGLAGLDRTVCLLEEPVIFRKSRVEPQFRENSGGAGKGIFAIRMNFQLLVLWRIPVEERVSHLLHRGMNEVAGLERNSAQEGAEGSAGANDLAVLEAGNIDSLGKLRAGTQLLDRTGSE